MTQSKPAAIRRTSLAAAELRRQFGDVVTRADNVPDYLARLQKGEFYGWLYAYLSPKNLDPRLVEDGRSLRPDLVAWTWGRPVGVLAMPDGSLLFTEEAHGWIYRVQFAG